MVAIQCPGCSAWHVDQPKPTHEHTCVTCGKPFVTEVACVCNPLACWHIHLDDDRVVVGEIGGPLPFREACFDLKGILDAGARTRLQAGLSRIKYGAAMMQRVANKEEGWCNQQERYRLLDSTKSKDQMYLRYCRFRMLNLGIVEEGDRWKYYQDLIPLKAGLVFGNAIGLADKYPFTLKEKSEAPIRSRPFLYAHEERAGIRNYMCNQEQLGIVRRIKPGEQKPTFKVGVILVKEG